MSSVGGQPNRWPILAVNIYLGGSGSGIGWAAALIWALHAVHRPDEVAGSQGGESGLNLFVNDVRDVRVVGSGGAGAASAGGRLTSAAAVAEIERLGRLRATGALSDDEFAVLKASIIVRL